MSVACVADAPSVTGARVFCAVDPAGATVAVTGAKVCAAPPSAGATVPVTGASA